MNSTGIPTMPEIPTAAPQAPQAPSQPTAPQAPQAQEIPGQPQRSQSTQSTQTQQYTLDIVGKVNFPSKQLFEATGFVDVSKTYPSSNAFLLFVPGRPDSTKATGTTYVQEQKETMKVMIRDLFGLAEALKYAAMYKKNPGFNVFTDSGKYAGNQGQAVRKMVSVTVAPSSKDPSKVTIFLSYKGQAKITLAMEEWHAIGLAGQLLNLASEVERKKFITEKNAMTAMQRR